MHVIEELACLKQAKQIRFKNTDCVPIYVIRCVRVTAAGRGKQSVLRILAVHAALFIFHAVRMSLIILSSTTFSTLSHKSHELRKNDVEHKMCVLIFSRASI